MHLGDRTPERQHVSIRPGQSTEQKNEPSLSKGHYLQDENHIPLPRGIRGRPVLENCVEREAAFAIAVENELSLGVHWWLGNFVPQPRQLTGMGVPPGAEGDYQFMPRSLKPLPYILLITTSAMTSLLLRWITWLNAKGGCHPIQLRETRTSAWRCSQ
jgi:hypothetical protein